MTNSKTVRFTINFVEKTITGTKASFTKAGKGYGAEYDELADKIAKHPHFELIVKESQTKSTKAKTTYNGLNFEFMEEYISIQTNAEDIMRRYEAAKKMANDRGTKVYPFTKMWFLKEFENFNIEEAKEEIIAARMAKINAPLSDNIENEEERETAA